MLFIGSLAIFFIALAMCRKMHQRLVLAKFRFHVFALRDELRMLAIENKISSKSFAFNFFDGLFSRTINDAYYLTLFHLVMVGFRNPNILSDENFNSRYSEALAGNDELNSIVHRFYNASTTYISGQHWLTINMLLRPLFRMAWGSYLLKKRTQLMIERALVNTEGNPGMAFVQNSR
jgi:hypothetical protein